MQTTSCAIKLLTKISNLNVLRERPCEGLEIDGEVVEVPLHAIDGDRVRVETVDNGFEARVASLHRGGGLEQLGYRYRA